MRNFSEFFFENEGNRFSVNFEGMDPRGGRRKKKPSKTKIRKKQRKVFFSLRR
jgi:hypothetical protein